MSTDFVSKNLFGWESLEDLGSGMVQCGQITLTNPIGGFAPGTNFEYGTLVLESSHLQLEDAYSTYWVFDLIFSIAGVEGIHSPGVCFEQQFFTWKDWDYFGQLDLIFYDCTLAQPLGDWKSGDTIQSVRMNLEKGIAEFRDGDMLLGSFPISVRVVDSS